MPRLVTWSEQVTAVCDVSAGQESSGLVVSGGTAAGTTGQAGGADTGSGDCRSSGNALIAGGPTLTGRIVGANERDHACSGVPISTAVTGGGVQDASDAVKYAPAWLPAS